MKKFLVAAVLIFVLTVHVSATNKTSPLKCYQCTSVDNKRCDDPFEATETLAECPKYGWGDTASQAIFCRKLRQTIDTPLGKQIRIIRSCGYIKNNQYPERDDNCFKASFIAATSSRYCTCNREGCNAGETITKFPSILIIVTIIYTLFTMF